MRTTVGTDGKGYCLPGEECQSSATRTAQLPPGRALDCAGYRDPNVQHPQICDSDFLGSAGGRFRKLWP